MLCNNTKGTDRSQFEVAFDCPDSMAQATGDRRHIHDGPGSTVCVMLFAIYDGVWRLEVRGHVQAHRMNCRGDAPDSPGVLGVARFSSCGPAAASALDE